MSKLDRDFINRHKNAIVLIVLVVIGIVLYTYDLSNNPPGFFIDESSVAYNANQIARTGRDEFGNAWPLFFRAFGEYKNPIYIYLLAAIFRITGPSIFIARLFSSALNLTAAMLLGLLAFRITRRPTVGLLLMLTASLTPWLFELSRVVVEVAAYPPLVVLFLIFVNRASQKQKWSWVDTIGIAASLTLLTYTYSIGRVLAPLLALGLVILVTKLRLVSILKAWLAYALSLVPLLIFHMRHPGALSTRYELITYITPKTTYAEDAFEFLKHYVANINPWKMVWSGDPNIYQIASVYGLGPVLAATLALVAGSLFLLIRNRQLDCWWRFVLYGLAVAFVPASLTKDHFHTLRLAPVPVLMLVLTIPAIAWLIEKQNTQRRALLIAVMLIAFAQTLFFHWRYYQNARLPLRLDLFDVDYPNKILPTAISAAGSSPIYIADAPSIPGYIQALWHQSLQDIPPAKFVRLAPGEGAPDGAIVISTEDTCPRCEIIFKRWPYTVYLAKGPPRSSAPLPAEAFRAEIRILDSSVPLHPGQAGVLRVAVRNTSTATWFACDRAATPYQISLGNHWLNKDGGLIVNDDGRAILTQDLVPGQELQFQLTVNAPRRSGEYLLELDMLQEGVSWFGLRGSGTARLPITVE